jgi:hypothetical protein
MRDVKTIDETSSLNGSSTYPVWPKTGVKSTTRHMAGSDSLMMWVVILLMGIVGLIAMSRSDAVHAQLENFRARMIHSEADRREIHREIRAIEP